MTSMFLLNIGSEFTWWVRIDDPFTYDSISLHVPSGHQQAKLINNWIITYDRRQSVILISSTGLIARVFPTFVDIRVSDTNFRNTFDLNLFNNILPLSMMPQITPWKLN